jgi:hypothetical protein
MIKDSQLEMSAAQAVTASAASTNVLDFGAAGEVIGHEPYLVVQVREAADSSGDAATVAISLQTSVDEAFSSPITLFSTAAIAQASLTLNSEPVKVRLPFGMKQYCRVYYTVGTENLTKGKFDAFLTPDCNVSA